MITSIVSLPAQIVTSSDSLDMCPDDCEQCARASQLYDALVNDVTNEKVNEDIREYILNTDLRHVKDCAWNDANILGASYISLSDYDAEVVSITMLTMFHRLITSCDLITSMGGGREYNILEYWLDNFSYKGSSALLPSILIETITMINTYEFHVQNNIVPQEYFYNGLRTFIEEVAYGDSRYMNQLMPEYEETLDRLLTIFEEYVPDGMIYDFVVSHSFPTCISFIELAQPYGLNILHFYDRKLANLFIENLEDLLLFFQFNLPGILNNETTNNLRLLSLAMDRGDDYNATIERVNTKIWGAQGAIRNTYNRAVSINIDKLKLEYIEYQESLIEKGYEFAYYSPIMYPGEIAEEDYDVFYEYCSKTCRLLGEMWKVCRGARDTNILEQNIAAIGDFFNVEYIESYTLTLSFFLYYVDTLVALTTIENCLPVAEAAQEIMELPLIPNVAAMYYNLGNYGLGDNITKFILLRNVPLFVENAAYENPNNVATYVLDALEALTLSTTDYSAFISEYCDKVAPIIGKINQSNFGLDYVQQQIY
jgi:hypothetical protein